MDTIFTLGNLPVTCYNLAGGKGGTLARLRRKKFPVPDGLVILPAAFENDGLNETAWKDAREHLRKLRKSGGTSGFAVRSSAAGEDATLTSFAGEFETVLNVSRDEDIRQAINTVYRSRCTERVMAYSSVHGMKSPPAMAVIVQEMVPADYAGILFTADPVSGNHLKMVGSFVDGLGDKLVSGATDGESFTLSRPGGGYQGPEVMRPFATRLFRLGKRLEAELKDYQDIEWALAGGKLYLLQARPITTMQSFNPETGEWNDSHRGDFLWSNTNIGEALSGVFTPLAWTVFRAYLQGSTPVFYPGHISFGNICGRAYANFGEYAAAFNRTGFKREMALRLVEHISGQVPDDIRIPPCSMTWMDALLALLTYIADYYRMMILERISRTRYLKFLSIQNREVMGRINAVTDGAGLAYIYRSMIVKIARGSQFYTVMFANQAQILNLIQPRLKKIAGAQDATALLSGISDHDEQLESMRPLVDIARVSRGEMDREEYISRYGYRGIHEGDIASPKPIEDPGWLDRQLSAYAAEAAAAEAMRDKQVRLHREARQRLIKKYPMRGRLYLRFVELFNGYSRLRELYRSRLTESLYTLRRWALKAGELLGMDEDVFLLTLDELLALLKGKDCPALETIPQRRTTYERYRSYPPYPAYIRGRFDPEPWLHDPRRRSDRFGTDSTEPVTMAGKVLYGRPGAGGIVEGTVRILKSIEDSAELQKGEVLVSVITNIGWTPVFPRAAAVITDVGSSLSHAAIVARELGLPAVVGCTNATMLLKTGDRVRVDGLRGTVEILTGSDLDTPLINKY